MATWKCLSFGRKVVSEHKQLMKFLGVEMFIYEKILPKCQKESTTPNLPPKKIKINKKYKQDMSCSHIGKAVLSFKDAFSQASSYRRQLGAFEEHQANDGRKAAAQHRPVSPHPYFGAHVQWECPNLSVNTVHCWCSF